MYLAKLHRTKLQRRTKGMIRDLKKAYKREKWDLT